MYLKEVVIQGLFGVAKGVRLPLNAGLCEPLLPPPLDTEKFKRVVTLLFYPADAQKLGGISVDTEVPHPVRLGAVLDIGGLEYKVMWDFRENNLAVFSGAAAEPVASGVDDVQALWGRLLGLLPFQYFGPLHLHDFTEGNAEGPRSDETGRLIHEFRRSLTIERLETEIAGLETQLGELKSVKNPAVKAEAALDKVTAQLKNFERIPDLPEADRQFLDGYEKRMQSLRSESEEVGNSLADAQRRQGLVTPTPVFSDRLFWLGMGAGAAFIAAGVILGQLQGGAYRALALGDIAGFGLATMIALRHLDLRGRFKMLQVRIDHLESRRQELAKTIERESTRAKKLQKRYEVETTTQIIESLRTRDELREKRTKLEERIKEHLRDPIFIKQRKDINELKERIDPLKARRASLGDFAMPTYELRSELTKRGVAVDSLQPLDVYPETSLVEAARLLRYVPQGGTTAAAALDVINRLVAPIVGKQQAQVALENGYLVVTEDRTQISTLRELESRAQGPWLRAVALGILIQHNKDRLRSGEHASMIVLDNPWDGMQRNDRIRFYSLLKELAKTFQVVLPKTGE